MLPSQALLLLCHLDNDLVTIITYIRSRIQLAPHARRRDVPMIVSERMPARCTDDEVANSGRTGITTAYTEDMLSRERTMDCTIYIAH